MTLIFTRLTDAVDINGTPVEQNWKATDELTGVSISKNYLIAETQANIEADLTALFPANPVANEDSLVTLKVLKIGDSYKVIGDNGKPLLEFKKDASGNSLIDMIDGNGNKRRVLTPQSGTVKLDAVATTLDVTFDEAYTSHPVVTVNSSKPLPNHDLNVSKTGFKMDFATAPDSTISYQAQSNKK